MKPSTLEQTKSTKGNLRIYNCDFQLVIAHSEWLMIDS